MELHLNSLLLMLVGAVKFFFKIYAGWHVDGCKSVLLTMKNCKK